MDRVVLQKLSRMRQREARALLRAGHAPGAYYLVGYSVECALKACIAKRTRRHEFPDRVLAQQAHTHDLEKLVGLTDFETDFAAARVASVALESNWLVAKEWNESSRYDGTISLESAAALLRACTAKSTGLLDWIRKRW